MDFSVGGVYNATAECAAATNSMLRLFKPTRRTSNTPLYELNAPPTAYHNWNKATPESACGPEWQTSLDRSTGFSAACFFYAQELQQRLQVPVGAVHTAWGGTNIENWMSAEAMSACTNHTPPGTSEVPAPSLLFNSMIQPFVPMVVATFLWWQGESNAWTVANAQEYSCNQKAMINDLRIRFDGANEAVLPFVFMQSFPCVPKQSSLEHCSRDISERLLVVTGCTAICQNFNHLGQALLLGWRDSRSCGCRRRTACRYHKSEWLAR